MLHQNLFDPIPLVGSADKLMTSDLMRATIISLILLLQSMFLAKKEAHICEVYEHAPFFLFHSEIIFFSISLYLTTYSVGIESLWPQTLAF